MADMSLERKFYDFKASNGVTYKIRPLSFREIREVSKTEDEFDGLDLQVEMGCENPDAIRDLEFHLFREIASAVTRISSQGPELLIEEAKKNSPETQSSS